MVPFSFRYAPIDLVVDCDKPLLRALREDLGLGGPRYGCGVAQCSPCRALVNGESGPSTVTFFSKLKGAEVLTIEGLMGPVGRRTEVHQAWIEEKAPQCGCCEPRFIIAATTLLARPAKSPDLEINEAITTICCGRTYSRLGRAVHRAAASQSAG